ncbi:protein of unknown function [Shewanella benthica]|uniref:Uncharacterized protein n=1 Tax=Shewanella benthica TaxID=43661 RepID=A0A330M5Y9_9GAMM|nr:protein of unknown function [Shewanella benthica]
MEVWAENRSSIIILNFNFNIEPELTSQLIYALVPLLEV